MRSAFLFLLGLIGILGIAHAQSFHGYDCTVDCSGHEAGYEWAEEKGIDDADDCSGKSNSFVEGCQAYAEENGDNEDDDEDEDEGE
jgi:hypothetical protein